MFVPAFKRLKRESPIAEDNESRKLQQVQPMPMPNLDPNINYGSPMEEQYNGSEVPESTVGEEHKGKMSVDASQSRVTLDTDQKTVRPFESLQAIRTT